MDRQPEALLITGVYGSGKSSTAIEIAYILDRVGAKYAVLDLDWLSWFGPEDEDLCQRVLSQNLSAVVGNYRAAGCQLYVLAYAVESVVQLEALKRAIDMPLKVVRLTVALSEIRRRLQPDATTERRGNLVVAEAWLAKSKGAGFEDLILSNDQPLQNVAAEIIAWAQWP